MGTRLGVIDAIFTTGAQRRLRPDPVPDEIVWEILDAAIRGPSGGNSQGWRWVVVTDDAVKSPIAERYLEAWNELSNGRREQVLRLVDRARRRGDRRELALAAARLDPNYRAGEHLAANIRDAPVWVFAVVTGVKGEPSVVDGANIFGAVQNLLLAARAHGIGGTLTMLHRQDERGVAALLDMPPDARALALIPLGYPEREFFRVRRKPVESVVYWGRWGATRTRPVEVQAIVSG